MFKKRDLKFNCIFTSFLPATKICHLLRFCYYINETLLYDFGAIFKKYSFPQGNRLSCRNQEGRRGSEEAVPGPSVLPSGEPGVSGAFGGRRKAVRDRFALQGGTGDFP